MAEGRSMPMGQAGLIRYFDEEERNSLQFDPRIVVGGIVGLIVLELLLQAMVGL